MSDEAFLRIPNVTAKCTKEGCKWQRSGTVILEADEITGGGLIKDRGTLVKKCRRHHNHEDQWKPYRNYLQEPRQHDVFTLTHYGEYAGFASISSNVCNGFCKLV